MFQVAQLTGFSDPIYAEAYVNVNQYDIVLDVLIVNQTSDTLQNVTLELATLGRLAASKPQNNDRTPPVNECTSCIVSSFKAGNYAESKAGNYTESTLLHR